MDHKVSAKPMRVWDFNFYLCLHIPLRNMERGITLGWISVSWTSTEGPFFIAKTGKEKQLWGKMQFDCKYWCLQNLGFNQNLVQGSSNWSLKRELLAAMRKRKHPCTGWRESWRKITSDLPQSLFPRLKAPGMQIISQLPLMFPWKSEAFGRFVTVKCQQWC